MSSTVVIEFHGYRGISRVGGPLGEITTLGFISISWMPFLLSDWLRQRVGAMKNALKPERFPEMAAYGDEPVKVPHRVVHRGKT